MDSDVKNIVNTILNHENIPRKKAKFTNFVKNIMRNRASAHSIDKTWELFSQALAPPTPPPTTTTTTTVETSQMEVETVVERKESKKEKKKKKKRDQDESEDSENNVKKSKKQKKKSNDEEGSEKENSEVKTKKKTKKDKNKDVDDDSPLKTLKRKADDDETETGEIEEPAAKKVKQAKFNWEESIEEILKKNDGSIKMKKLKKKIVNELLASNSSKPMTPEEASAKFEKKIKKMSKFKVLHDRVSLKDNSDSDKNPAPEADSVVAPIEEETKQKPKQHENSFNNWESANLGSSSQNEKFRRLMGIKNPGKQGSGMFGGAGRNDKKIFNDLEQGFERARQMHFGGRCFES